MAEVLRCNLDNILSSSILDRLNLEKGQYMPLSAHREEHIDSDSAFFSIFESVNELAGKYNVPIIYSCHPRSRKRLEESKIPLHPLIVPHEPLGFFDHNNLQINAMAVISDSGTLPEEAAFYTSIGMPFPAICIRTSTERPEAVDKGCFVLAGVAKKGIFGVVKTSWTII